MVVLSQNAMQSVMSESMAALAELRGGSSSDSEEQELSPAISSPAMPTLVIPNKATLPIRTTEKKPKRQKREANDNVATKCKHTDRQVYARGMCGPCYQRCRNESLRKAGGYFVMLLQRSPAWDVHRRDDSQEWSRTNARQTGRQPNRHREQKGTAEASTGSIRVHS